MFFFLLKPCIKQKAHFTVRCLPLLFTLQLAILLHTETQFNVSKMSLPFHFEWHQKNPCIFRILGFVCQYCRMNWSRLQNCVRALMSPGGMWGWVLGRHSTDWNSELLRVSALKEIWQFYFFFHPIHSTHSVTLNLHLKKKCGWIVFIWDEPGKEAAEISEEMTAEMFYLKLLELHCQENFWFWWTAIFLHVIL